MPPMPSDHIAERCQGSRDHQEDTYVIPHFGDNGVPPIYAVFDGHGGAECSKWCAQNLVRVYRYIWSLGSWCSIDQFLLLLFLVLNESLRERSHGATGCTGTIVVVTEEEVISANVGDSEAHIIRGSEIIELTQTHRPGRSRLEDSLVEKAGVSILGKRVGGLIAVSRSLGDFDLQPGISGLPTVRHYPRSDEDLLLVVATDGLWDSLSAEDLPSCDDNIDLPYYRDTVLHKLRNKRIGDNCTFILAKLRPQQTMSSGGYTFHKQMRKDMVPIDGDLSL